MANVLPAVRFVEDEVRANDVLETKSILTLGPLKGVWLKASRR